MLSSNTYKKVCINITYKKCLDENHDMDNKRSLKENQRFICSICLNTIHNDNKHFENRNVTKSCSICQRNCNSCNENKKGTKIDKEFASIIHNELENTACKTVQTSQTDIAQGLDLLNEVLTVFQSKKQIDVPKEKVRKNVIFRDASVSTELARKNNLQTKLALSKVFQFSIEDNGADNVKFTVLNGCEPDAIRNSKIDLIKHKSSSIPQMKMEELKNSLKEKTKSKDAVEEVNRMFAIMNKNAPIKTDTTNRPMIRHGPRVLPVVKTNKYEEIYRKTLDSSGNDSDFTEKKKANCKCQTTNFCMSSGDSNKECCHKAAEDGKCDKCVYMLCCRYQNRKNQIQNGIMTCECCDGSSYHCKHDCNRD